MSESAFQPHAGMYVSVAYDHGVVFSFYSLDVWGPSRKREIMGGVKRAMMIYFVYVCSSVVT